MVLTSPDDPRSGLRVSRRFEVPATGAGFRQQVRFENVSASPITWAIWEVVQIDSARSVGLPAEEAGVDIEVAAHPGDGASDQASAVPVIDLGTWRGRLQVSTGDRLATLPVQDVVAKRGFPTATGTVRYREPGGGQLSLTYSVDDLGSYPDQGSRAQVWMQCPVDRPLTELGGLHPRDHLLELEVVGPITRLEPEGQSSLDLTWSLETSPRRP